MEDKSNETPQHKLPRSRKRVLTLLAWATAAVLVICGGTGGYLYWKLNGNIKTVDINSALGSDRPAASTTGAMNILILGSDSRSGGNSKVAGGTDDGTARSDTAMVIHVNEAHTHADVVSIPRDTLVTRPTCGTKAGASGVMFNTAYEVGGATCAVKTVESMTGLRMDHYIEVDFEGFAKLVDALGGVTVTTTVDINDTDSGLHLKAGTHKLTGQQALDFVRTRHGVGDGSDLGRIELQQQFVKSLMSQVQSLGLLTDPVKLYELASTATSAITTDSDLGSVTSLVSFAESMKKIKSADITAVTMPNTTAPSDPNRVVALEPEATELWTALQNDVAVPESVKALQSADPATSVSASTAG
ncbi:MULTISPECIES: LCP family protein [Streptacidiphilus]|uniref:LCP family protein n=2 Tax=Streptacidiphilus TaxID=228398 RepID=A0ABV6UN29_9ACTN|nr:LCP family protein [Streptacidiphilus jeojiense]